jgi:hypothetical protein
MIGTRVATPDIDQSLRCHPAWPAGKRFRKNDEFAAGGMEALAWKRRPALLFAADATILNSCLP